MQCDKLNVINLLNIKIISNGVPSMSGNDNLCMYLKALPATGIIHPPRLFTVIVYYRHKL